MLVQVIAKNATTKFTFFIRVDNGNQVSTRAQFITDRIDRLMDHTTSNERITNWHYSYIETVKEWGREPLDRTLYQLLRIINPRRRSNMMYQVKIEKLFN